MSDSPERERAEDVIRRSLVDLRNRIPDWTETEAAIESEALAAVSRLVERADAYEDVVSDLRKAEANELRLVERERELTRALGQADDLLRRLSEWDVLNLAPGSGDDGPYWQREIAKVREALAGGVSAAGRPPVNLDVDPCPTCGAKVGERHSAHSGGGTAAVAEAGTCSGLTTDDSEIRVVGDGAREAWHRPEREVTYTRDDYERDKARRTGKA